MIGCSGTIESNTICANSAYEGAGLHDCRGTMRNNTICANTAQMRGGGLRKCPGVISNCIIWGNTAPLGPEFDQSSVPAFSCIQDWTGGGEGNSALNPRFVDPDGPDNNPETWEDNDYRLLPDSPCIDAGKNEDWMWGAADLDGNQRIWHGKVSLTVDMGAYEYGSQATSLTNARALQHEDSMLVDVYYEVYAVGPEVMTVSFSVSSDGGATWSVPVVTATGEVGPGVAQGRQSFTWNAGVDYAGRYSTTMMVKVTATDGLHAPASATSPVFTLDTRNFMFRDDFDGTRRPEWSFYVPKPGPEESFEDAGRWTLNIPSSTGVYNHWDNEDSAPMLLLNISGVNQDGDFTIETHLAWDGGGINSPFHAGICVYFGQFDAIYWGPYTGTVLRAERSGYWLPLCEVPYTSQDVYLRVCRIDDTYHFLYSSDPLTGWKWAGGLEAAGTPIKVGLIGKTWGGTLWDVKISFDYLMVQIPPTRVVRAPYYSQGGTKWCAIVSAQMALKYFGIEKEMSEIAKYFNKDMNQGLTGPEITGVVPPSSPSLPKYLSRLSLSHEVFLPGLLPRPLGELRQSLGMRISTGCPVLLSCPTIQHTVLVVGVDGDTIYVNDPSGAFLCAASPSQGECSGDFERLVCLRVPWEDFQERIYSGYEYGIAVTAPRRNDVPAITLEFAPGSANSWFNPDPTGDTGSLYISPDGTAAFGYKWMEDRADRHPTSSLWGKRVLSSDFLRPPEFLSVWNATDGPAQAELAVFLERTRDGAEVFTPYQTGVDLKNKSKQFRPFEDGLIPWKWYELSGLQAGQYRIRVEMSEGERCIDSLELRFYLALDDAGPVDTDGDGISDDIDPDDDNDGLNDLEEETGTDDWGTALNPRGKITDPLDADTDHDGQDDGAESLAGTDPADSESVFALTQVSVGEGGSNLKWNSFATRSYQVWHSQDMLSWTLVSGAIPGGLGSITEWSEAVPRGTPQGYFRVEVLP
ncbi:MAG: C39 family peptidase [bacterium]|nr:C39 family peptidase [bacterium]